MIFTPLCAFTSNQNMGASPRCVGIGLYAWFPFGQVAVAMVIVVFDHDAENKKSHAN